MLVFEYKALDRGGAVVAGTIECASKGEVFIKLKADGLTLLDVSTKGAVEKARTSFMPTIEWNKIRPGQIAFLFRQLGELIEAGLPVATAISSLERFCGHDKTKKLLADVGRRVRSGQSFYEAMEAQVGMFSRVQLALMKIGEKSGALDDVLCRIADLMEAQMELRGKIRSALMYPFFILGFSSLLCWGLVTFLLPTFIPIWEGSKVDLNDYPVTLMLIRLSKLMKSFTDEAMLLFFLAGLVLVFKRMLTTPEGQDALGKLVLKIPLLGSYLQLTATAEASSTMGRLLESGMPLLEALDLTAETASNPVIANALKLAAVDLRQGNDLSVAFERMDVFPQLFVQMVAVGESTGNLPSMLSRVSTYYKRQLDDSLKGMTALIEPLMMVVIGGIVFVFILGVFLPVVGIVSNLSH